MKKRIHGWLGPLLTPKVSDQRGTLMLFRRIRNSEANRPEAFTMPKSEL